MKLIIDNQLFPCIDFFKVAARYTNIEIEKYERFEKRSFRNRYIIASANGLSILTVPIKGGRDQKALITDINIDYTTNWQTKHWRSITSAYAKAPFFDFYAEEVKGLIFNLENNLFNFNITILTEVCKWLKIRVLMEFTKEFIIRPEGVDYRNKILPGNFQKDAENWQPKYSQVFEDRLGFQANLSILDLLFCKGPNAANLLRQGL